MADEKTAEDVATNIADSLGAAWDEATAEDAPAEQEAAPEAAEGPEEAPEPEQEEAVEAEEEGDETVEATAEESESESPIEPPASLSDEEKAVFADLPEEVQEFISRRERERDSAFQQKTQDIAEVRAAFEPYKEMLALNGVNEAQAIQRLLNAQQYLQRDPLNAIKQLAHNFGVLDKLAPQPQESEEYLDPTVADLKKQIEELKGNLNQQAQSAQQVSQQEILQQIANFKTQVDAKGDLAHPHFEKVKHLMAPLVQQGKTMEEAYSDVIYTLPEVREAEIAKAKAAAAKEKQGAQKKRVAKAKKTATHVKGSTRQETPDKPTSLKGMLESAFDEATTGG